VVLEENRPWADLLQSVRNRSFTGSMLAKTWR
jgi:hypothetical protein